MPTDVASYNSEPACKTKQGQFSFLVLSAGSVLSAEGSEEWNESTFVDKRVLRANTYCFLARRM